MTTPNKIGDLAVHWFPQIPCKPFAVPVADVADAVRVMDMLADYDAFQYDHRIKPDYSNAGVLSLWVGDCDGEGTPGWEDWCDDETGESNPHAWLAALTEG